MLCAVHSSRLITTRGGQPAPSAPREMPSLSFFALPISERRRHATRCAARAAVSRRDGRPRPRRRTGATSTRGASR
eukprot:2239052-Rhodomonas_salina.1